jgi:hypothetical protein
MFNNVYNIIIDLRYFQNSNDRFILSATNPFFYASLHHNKKYLIVVI